MKLIAEWLTRALILLVTAYFVPGFKIDSYLTALIVAMVLGVLNMFVKPILIILTLPVTVITLGLFMFVINAFLLLLTASLVRGFQIESFGTAIVASIIITLVSSLLNRAFK